jgi:hypothetical protein
MGTHTAHERTMAQGEASESVEDEEAVELDMIRESVDGLLYTGAVGDMRSRNDGGC